MKTNLSAPLKNPFHRSSRREEAHTSSPQLSTLNSQPKSQSLVTSAATIAFAAALLLASAGSALADVRYVDVNSTNATPPYSSWSTAATNIQDAVDSAVAGDEIVVTNGIYATGGRAAISWDNTFNRVVVEKPLSIRSVNGPQLTVIDGDLRVRCVYLVKGASLSGFTLTNGSTSSSSIHGGGVLCEPAGAVVSTCVLTGNFRGGAWYCTLNNCTLTGNSVNVFGAADETGSSYASARGGGAAYCTLNNCTLIGNSARGTNTYSSRGQITVQGGGSYCCTLNNCILSGNSVFASIFGGPLNTQFDVLAQGGGAYYSTLNNCTLISNSVGLYIPLNNFAEVSVGGGGAADCKTTNCIASFNKRITSRGRFLDDNVDSSTIRNCWVDSDPLFVDLESGDLHLQFNSPCINAGLNASAPAGPDLDGNPRIAGGSVDIGAYEFQSPASMISYAWLQQFNLPIDPSTDTADPDGDSLNNWQEWRCATDPTNALSALRMLAPTVVGSDLLVRWESVADRTYFLERSMDASSAFTPLATGIPGQPGTTTYTHTNAIGTGPFFYLVGVSTP